jgi:hypothetical protein
MLDVGLEVDGVFNGIVAWHVKWVNNGACIRVRKL